MNNFIIGMTGAFGSGCSFLADNFLVRGMGFKKFSLSDVLKELFCADNNGRSPVDRHELQEYGNKIRETQGADYLAIKTLEKMLSDSQGNESICYVVDSIRNPAEIKYFRNHCVRFYLFAIFADEEVRWKRVADVYDNKRDAFRDDEWKDRGADEPAFGQKISDCFFEADLILSNNENINIEYPNQYCTEMSGKLSHYVKAFQQPERTQPQIEETLMALAYTNGRLSRCQKRKVGALIADDGKRVISTGFNDVPKGLDDCVTRHGRCYRDILRERWKRELPQELPETLVKQVVRQIKLLELCRSLHAEENAILNLVNTSMQTDLSKCTLYATTFPCNLCANKIVQVGIKNVMYFEPYPVEEAKIIFKDAGVTAVPFEGVTFRAFFKAYTYAVD